MVECITSSMQFAGFIAEKMKKLVTNLIFFFVPKRVTPFEHSLSHHLNG